MHVSIVWTAVTGTPRLPSHAKTLLNKVAVVCMQRQRCCRVSAEAVVLAEQRSRYGRLRWQQLLASM